MLPSEFSFRRQSIKESGQNRLLQADGTQDCGLRIAECGLKNSGLLINPQSEFYNPQSVCSLAAGGSDLPSVALGHRRRGDDAEAPLLPPHRPCGSRVGQGRALLAQKVSFSPSCMLRAGPAAVSVPKEALARLTSMSRKFVRLKALKMSACSCSLKRSLRPMRLRTEKSQTCEPGPSTVPTPAVPRRVSGAEANAARLTQAA